MDTLSLKAIASAGGSLIISAKGFDVLSLKSIAAAGQATGAQLTIKDANKLDVLSCKGIASANPGHVVFDFV